MRGKARKRIGVLGSSGLCAAVLLLVLPLTGAFAQSSEEIERELRETEQESERFEQELDAVQRRLSTEVEELADIGLRLEAARGELVAAEGQVALAEMALEEAEEDRDQAREEHEEAVSLLARAEAELADAERKLTTQLVESFKYGSAGAQRGAMVLEVLRRAEDPNSFSVGMKQLRTVIDDQDSTVTEVFRLRDERSDMADAAALARREASQAAVDAERTLEMLEELKAEAERIAAEIETDEARQQQVIASLEQSESELAATLDRVSQRESELRADFRAAREREAEERAAQRAAERAAQQRSSGSGGGGRGGSLPGADGGPFIDGMVCPVQGAVAGRDFSNDWGYPRSGGRWHQGNDVFANRGTPVLAVDDGVVVSWNPPSSPTALGGITLTYETADGSQWYNAHLDAIADGVSPGTSVSRGQVIGTVGNTGNARTTPPHLHIGRRYGGQPVNPWPSISQVCR